MGEICKTKFFIVETRKCDKRNGKMKDEENVDEAKQKRALNMYEAFLLGQAYKRQQKKGRGKCRPSSFLPPQHPIPFL